MKMVPLATLAEKIDYGVTASASAADIGPKFLRITDIQDGAVDWDSVPFCDASNGKLARSRLDIGDIVFARTGATTGKSYLIRSCPEDAVFASYLIRVRAGRNVDPGYLARFFESAQYWRQLAAKTVGAAQPGVNASKLGELLIPLPHLSDQRRIAAILDQADEVRRKRAAALVRLARFQQALFYEMFGDPQSNPKGWRVGCIGDLLREVRYGTAAKANTEGLGLPILRMGNITYDGRIDLSDLKHVQLPNKDVPKYTTRRGDILFNRTNSKELVGKTAVVQSSEPMAIAGYLIRARVNDLATPEYISAYLNSRHGKAVLSAMCKNIVGMANINAQEMQKIAIAVPPVHHQKKYSDSLSTLETKIVPMREALKRSEALFASLQNRAFRGEF